MALTLWWIISYDTKGTSNRRKEIGKLYITEMLKTFNCIQFEAKFVLPRILSRKWKNSHRMGENFYK